MMMMMHSGSEEMSRDDSRKSDSGSSDDWPAVMN